MNVKTYFSNVEEVDAHGKKVTNIFRLIYSYGSGLLKRITIIHFITYVYLRLLCLLRREVKGPGVRTDLALN